MISLESIGVGFLSFMVLFLLSMNSVFSQDESTPPVNAVEIVTDIEVPKQVGDEAVDHKEQLNAYYDALQSELKVVARGELALARLACGLTSDQAETLWQAMLLRLKSMNDLFLYEDNFVIAEVVLEETDVLGGDIPVDTHTDGAELKDEEARQMEMELDDVELDLELNELLIPVAYTAEGVPLKANPYIRIRKEFRDALTQIVSLEQLERYDQECHDRDQFLRNSLMNAIILKLQKLLHLQPQQEKDLRLALVATIKDIDDLELSRYLYSVGELPEIADAEIKRLLTVRQRAKWNNFMFSTYPIQMPYIDSETEEDE